MTFAEQYVERILSKIGEAHRRDYWLREFSRSPQAAIVDAVEEFEAAVAKGGVTNPAGYFTSVFYRHRKALEREAEALQAGRSS